MRISSIGLWCSVMGSLALLMIWGTKTWPFYIEILFTLLAAALVIPGLRLLLAYAATSLDERPGDDLSGTPANRTRMPPEHVDISHKRGEESKRDAST